MPSVAFRSPLAGTKRTAMSSILSPYSSPRCPTCQEPSTRNAAFPLPNRETVSSSVAVRVLGGK